MTPSNSLSQNILMFYRYIDPKQTFFVVTDIALHMYAVSKTDFANCMVLHRCKVKGIIGELVSYRYGLGAYKSTAEL